MSQTDLDAFRIGDRLPAITLPAINRTTLALFAGATGDHNPIHIDIDYARQAGSDDVFAHGMLSMAYLGRLLTQWVDQRQIRSFGVRFAGITHLGACLTCSGEIVEKFSVDGEPRVKVAVRCVDQNQEVKLAGDAVVALSPATPNGFAISQRNTTA
jgi:acyl dehydratase